MQTYARTILHALSSPHYKRRRRAREELHLARVTVGDNQESNATMLRRIFSTHHLQEKSLLQIRVATTTAGRQSLLSSVCFSLHISRLTKRSYSGGIRRLSLRDKSGISIGRIEAQKEGHELMRSMSVDDGIVDAAKDDQKPGTSSVSIACPATGEINRNNCAGSVSERCDSVNEWYRTTDLSSKSGQIKKGFGEGCTRSPESRMATYGRFV